MKIILLIILSTFLGGCQTPIDKQFFPYEINPEEFSKVTADKKVYLYPVIAGARLPPIFRERITKEIKNALNKQGYDVVISDNFYDIAIKNRQAVDAYYDPKTGGKIQSSIDELLINTIKDLKKENNFSAVIMPRVTVQSIDLQDKRNQWGVWDGVKKDVITKGRMENPWISHIAMSLEIKILSTELDLIFFGRGGIEFLSKQIHEGLSFSRGTIKQEEVADEFIVEAVNIALYPFIESPIEIFPTADSYLKMVYRKIERYV